MGRYGDSQPEFRERSDRSSRRSGGRDRNRSSRRDNREGGFRERSDGFDRSNREMHDVVCDKCGKECQVPFKPSTNKPVFCNDCFRKDGDSSPRRNFDSRDSNMSSQSGISSEQFNKLNAKLDKIIELLESSGEDKETEEVEDE